MAANPQITFRANDSSSLFQSIKSRNSLVNPFDYSSESNFCPFSKSKIIVTPQTSISATNQQVVKFQLPNHMLLNKMYLKTSFNGGGDTNAGASNEIALTEFVGYACVQDIRIIYQGVEIWRSDGDSMFVSDYYRATKEQALILDYMTGGGDLGEEDGSLGNVTGRKAIASQGGRIDYAIPINAFFSEKLSTALDLAALSSPVFVEVNYRDVASVHEENDSTTTYAASELICYGVDLPPNERQNYNARNYSPGSVASQLGFSTSIYREGATIIRNSNTTEGALGTKIKLNSISGLVSKLYVWVTLDSDVTAKNRYKFVDIDLVRLTDGNQILYEIEHAHIGLDAVAASGSTNGYRVDDLVEKYNNGAPFSAGQRNPIGRIETMTLTDTGSDANITAAQKAASRINHALLTHTTDGFSVVGSGATDISKVKVIQFGFDAFSKSAADGVISFSNLNNPELEIKLSLAATSAAHTINVMAEFVDIKAYNTGSNGVVNIKQITE